MWSFQGHSHNNRAEKKRKNNNISQGSLFRSSKMLFSIKTEESVRLFWSWSQKHWSKSLCHIWWFQQRNYFQISHISYGWTLWDKDQSINKSSSDLSQQMSDELETVKLSFIFLLPRVWSTQPCVELVCACSISRSLCSSPFSLLYCFPLVNYAGPVALPAIPAAGTGSCAVGAWRLHVDTKEKAAAVRFQQSPPCLSSWSEGEMSEFQ